MKQIITSPPKIDKTLSPPGDKSISQRAVLLNSFSNGSATVSNLCEGADTASMIRCLRGIGTNIRRYSVSNDHKTSEHLIVHGKGSYGFSEPKSILNAGNSGGTMRMVAGLLAAQPFLSIITGDSSLRNRPMDRIITPLGHMGAMVIGRRQGSRAPLAIKGGDLHGIDITLEVASAQLKSCLIIAALHARGTSTITEPSSSRDHTERMVEMMGGNIKVNNLAVTVSRSDLSAVDIKVPGDISSAAFWLVAGCCHPNARIRLPNIGVNPSRTGILDTLKAMGGRIRMENIRDECGEPVADLTAESSQLKGVQIGGSTIPRIIDELPIVALAACFANSPTTIKNAAELRVKESDRIQTTAIGLSKLGARVEETPDGLVIHGGTTLTGTTCKSYNDHRIAMTLGIAGLLARGETIVDGSEAADISYPYFWETLENIQRPSHEDI